MTRKSYDVSRVRFEPLPAAERRHGSMDDKCCCRYCSADGHSSDKHNQHGVWDTRATDVVTGETWLVHYPELHERLPLREDDDE